MAIERAEFSIRLERERVNSLQVRYGDEIAGGELKLHAHRRVA